VLDYPEAVPVTIRREFGISSIDLAVGAAVEVNDGKPVPFAALSAGAFLREKAVISRILCRVSL
jgi:hypothetical protein